MNYFKIFMQDYYFFLYENVWKFDVNFEPYSSLNFSIFIM